ncbi:MAG: hypothetical protein U9R38_04625 [Candidatus Margulisiibacteriota bacterium]|nr:hypothetical protein [Candidatus Margulisiibacteriota bacterium]
MSVVNLAITATTIHRALAKRKMSYPYSCLLNHRLSPTIRALKKLANIDPVRYTAYQEMIDFLVNIAKSQKVKVKLTLHIPGLAALRVIDVERLMEDSDARRDIVKRCYLPTKGIIDLRPLIFINKLYTPGIKAAL